MEGIKTREFCILLAVDICERISYSTVTVKGLRLFTFLVYLPMRGLKSKYCRIKLAFFFLGDRDFKGFVAPRRGPRQTLLGELNA